MVWYNIHMTKALTEEQKAEINIDEIRERIAVFVDKHGFDPVKDRAKIAAHLDISVSELKEIFIKDRQERLLRKSELDSEDLLDLNLNDPELERKFGRAKLNIMKLKQTERQFLMETLGKDSGYSKRNELTGKNGEEIRIKEIIFNAPIIPQK